MEKRKTDHRHVHVGILLSCILPLFPSASVDASEPAGQAVKDRQTTAPAPPNETTVALKEIPVWEVASERVRRLLLRPSYTAREAEKAPQVKYPPFTSGTPLYGKTESSRLATRRSVHFALDCSRPGGDYDLLYFDENGDEDLTNDRPRRLSKEVTQRLAAQPSLNETYFELVKVLLDFGPGGVQSLELLPHLWTSTGSGPHLELTAAHVHVGEFKVDFQSYQAFLGYGFTIQGPLDQPDTTLILTPAGGEPASWWGADRLRAMHRMGSRYYRFSCTPTGDKLTVRPYEGALGIFEFAAGGRKVDKLVLRGSLESSESIVAVGDWLGDDLPGANQQSRIPVGDYYPALAEVEMGDLRFSFSNNYHPRAPGQLTGHAPVYSIAIRADKPYVLDLSNKPVVLFTQPQADARVRVGDEVKIEAVLVDPALDIMIGSLTDPARIRREPFKLPDGREVMMVRPWSYDPNAVITRANGEIVAKGTMPFG
jgi:hypothetical protein